MIVIANVFPKLQTVKIFVTKLDKEPRFRTGFGRQHVEASQILAKSPWERFYHVPLSFSEKLIWKMSPLLLCEILGVFVNKLTPDGKYPIEDCENLQVTIQMHISEKGNIFLGFLFHLINLHQILNILKKRMIVTANVFPKLQTVKIFLRKLSQEYHSRIGSGTQHVKLTQMLAKFLWEHFYPVFFFHSQWIWLGKCLP